MPSGSSGSFRRRIGGEEETGERLARGFVGLAADFQRAGFSA